MITPELTQYLKEAREYGMSDNEIREDLSAAGWKLGDIEQAIAGRTNSPFVPFARPLSDEDIQIMEDPAPPSHHGIFLFIMFLIVLVGAVMIYLYFFDTASYDYLVSQIKFYTEGKVWSNPQ